MWLFTKLGFFSVVCARLDGGKGRPDVTRLMIRARNPDHLSALKQAFPEQLGSTEIVLSDRTDYPARIFVPKDVFARSVLPVLAMQIDYDNFKSELTRSGQHKYHDACSSVWGVMLRLQPPRRREFVEPYERPSRFLDHDFDRRTHAPKNEPRKPKGDPESIDLPDADRVVVLVGEWSVGGHVMAERYIFENLDQYRRTRMAVRDAAQRGWCDPIARSRLALIRMTKGEADLKYPNLIRVDMKGVEPAKFLPAHLGFANRSDGTTAVEPSPEPKMGEVSHVGPIECEGCQRPLPDPDDIVWADADGRVDPKAPRDASVSWCVSCLPPQVESGS